jgi:hypothetical protein
MKIRKLITISLVSFISILSVSTAAGTPAENCTNNKNPHCLCVDRGAGGKNTLPDAAYFPDMHTHAKKVRNELCRFQSNEEDVRIAMIGLIEDSRGWFTKFGGFGSKVAFVDAIYETIDSTQGSIPNLGMPPIDTNESWQIQQHKFKPKNIATCDAVAEELLAESNCLKAQEEFVRLYQYAHQSYAIFNSTATLAYLMGKQNEWAEYEESARGQTALELMVNGYLYKKTETNSFLSPPEIQWILLHPMLVVENVNDALDGEQLDESLAVEIIGFNRWKNRRWYKPSGVSLVATYSDRPDIKDLGLGLAVHFNSTFSVGYTKRDDSDGVFISFDLFSLLNNKKKMLTNFLDK